MKEQKRSSKIKSDHFYLKVSEVIVVRGKEHMLKDMPFMLFYICSVSIKASGNLYSPCDPSVQEAQVYLEILWIPEICNIEQHCQLYLLKMH